MLRFTLSLTVALILGQPAFADDISIPLRLGEGYFQHLAEKKLFDDPGGTFVAWNDDTGCNHLVLSDPRVTVEPAGIRMRMRGEGRVGTPVGSLCVPLIPWQGEIGVLMQPVTEDGGKRVALRITDSTVKNARGGKDLGGAIWDWTKSHVHPRLSTLDIDLSGPLSDVRSAAVLLFPRDDWGPVDNILASLSIAEATPYRGGVLLRLSMAMDTTEGVITSAEPALTPAELNRVRDKLFKWDVLVTLAAKQAALHTADRSLRDSLLEVLLNTRHEIVWVLETAVPGTKDPVRGLFLETWARLAPLLREISAAIPDETALDFAAFIGAIDALQAIDAAGAGLNVDISVDGLRRLARFIAPPGAGDPMFYNEGVDPQLRELFDFGRPIPLPTRQRPSASGWLIGTAMAQPTMADIAPWLPTRRNISDYLRRVHVLLEEVGDKVLEDKALDSPFRQIFEPLLLASAWQETCWRQFVVKNGKQKPLKSSVGAVGIMQVLPRVWRGFYHPNPLNWDIEYNATAGAEILHHYLVHYAIRKEEHKRMNGLENLARATYSAYHGGPRHLTRYRKTDTSAKLKRIDKAFWKKYETVRAGDSLGVRQCYR